MIIDEGHTTAQMIAAPESAYYVIPHEASLSYFAQLRHKLRRDDLRLIKPPHIQSLKGIDCSGIVVDHAATLRGEEASHVQMIALRAQMKKDAKQ